MIFDARQIARGWLAVALASGNDKDRPQLHRTVHLEQHAHGLRLVATDSYVILHTYVPEVEHESDPAPSVDEAPLAVATAIDRHGRAKGFLAHVLKLATTQVDGMDPEPIDVALRLNVPAEDRDRWSLTGMEARTVLLEQPDVERIALDAYEGRYIDWRKLLADPPPKVATERVALNPEIVGRLAKVGKIHPSARIGWTFTGDGKPARVDVLDSDPWVDGIVMPARWDFDADRPRDEIEDGAPDDDGQEDDDE